MNQKTLQILLMSFLLSFSAVSVNAAPEKSQKDSIRKNRKSRNKSYKNVIMHDRPSRRNANNGSKNQYKMENNKAVQINNEIEKPANITSAKTDNTVNSNKKEHNNQNMKNKTSQKSRNQNKNRLGNQNKKKSANSKKHHGKNTKPIHAKKLTPPSSSSAAVKTNVKTKNIKHGIAQGQSGANSVKKMPNKVAQKTTSKVNKK